jgi:hypothetical protein
MTAPDATPHHGFLRRHWGKVTIAAIVVIPLAVFALWAAIALGYTYSSGERVGYVQKLSSKGWLCKTWEGELALSNVPGQIPEKFYFSVRSDSIAGVINATEGNRVSLTYAQHVGVPTSCFGETEYFVTGVRVLK